MERIAEPVHDFNVLSSADFVRLRKVLKLNADTIRSLSERATRLMSEQSSPRTGAECQRPRSNLLKNK